MPRATIVIPSRGGASRLPLLLAALASQTDPDWEAIVVLDGDVDNSEAVVRRFADELPVRAITFEENRGRVAALNAGFAEASGDVLIRCDDDLRPGTGYVAAHVAAHAQEDCGAVGLCRNVYPDTRYAELYGRDMDVRFRTEAYGAPDETAWRYWAGNVSVTKDTWERVGEYDLRYRAYGWEDVDYGYRIHALGLPVRLVPALETPHHVAATTTQIRAVRAFHSGAARHTFEGIHGAAHLTTPRHARLGPWEALVHATAVGLDAKRVDAWSRRIDAAIAVAPRWVAIKLIALAVEASAEAGYRRPIGTSNDV